MILITDGFGYPATNGPQHGYRGEVVTDTMDGLLYLLDMTGTIITRRKNVGYLLMQAILTTLMCTVTMPQEDNTIAI